MRRAAIRATMPSSGNGTIPAKSAPNTTTPIATATTSTAPAGPSTRSSYGLLVWANGRDPPGLAHVERQVVAVSPGVRGRGCVDQFAADDDDRQAASVS